MSNVLVINLSKGFGGGEVQTFNLLQGLSSNASNEIFFYGNARGLLIEKVINSLGRVTVVKNLFALLKLLLKRNVIIHAQDGRSAHLAFLLSIISRHPYIITRHVNFPLKGKFSFFSYKNANALIGVSKTVSNSLFQYNGNVFTIYGAINPPRENSNIEKKILHQNATLRFCHIGNLQYVKNFDLTIELAEKCQHNELDIHFFIVGDGELKSELVARASHLSNITFTGSTEFIGSVFKYCDIQLIPSHNEGLSLVLLEGFHYNIPVIAHNVGGMSELIEHGKTGYLIQSNHVDDYFEYVEQLYFNSELLSTLRKNIEDDARLHDFSIERMVDAHERLYQHIYLE